MKHSLYKLVIVTLVAVALLPLVAQTSLPQAADQFRRAYRQLLIYDHEEYENEYHYDNLEGSLIASSVTQTLDPDGWLSVQHSTLFLSYAACLSLGYSEGSAKLNALLSARDIHGRAISRLLWGAGIGAAGLLEYVVSPLSGSRSDVRSCGSGCTIGGRCGRNGPALGSGHWRAWWHDSSGLLTGFLGIRKGGAVLRRGLQPLASLMVYLARQ